MSCSDNVGRTIPGVGLPEPESESIRIRHFKECVLENSYKKQSQSCATCKYELDSTSYSAPGEHQKILKKIIKCPVYRKPPYSSACTSGEVVYTNAGEQTSVAGIDDIAIPVRNIGSSENTSRKKVSIEKITSASSSPFFRKPTLCIQAPQRAIYIYPYGQPGVPTAPLPPCVLGNRRVDYSTGV